MNWVKDNLEVVATVVFGVLAIVVSAWIAVWQHKPKRLGYEIKTNSSILAGGARGVGKLVSVKVANIELRNPWLVVIRIKNTGRKAVAAVDYVQPIRIEYSDNDVVASFLADQSSPGVNSGPYEEMAADEVVDFAPTLLNAGDWFDIQQLSDGRPARSPLPAVSRTSHGRCARSGSALRTTTYCF